MAANWIWSVAASKAALDAQDALVVNGYVRFYDDTGTVPLDCNEGNNTNVLLAEANITGAIFGAATGTAGDSDADMALSADLSSVSVTVTGDVAYFRIYASDGTTCHAQGTCGTSLENINFDDINWVAGGSANVTAIDLVQPTGK